MKFQSTRDKNAAKFSAAQVIKQGLRNVGTSLMQPIAVVCIGGLAYATLMTLFVVPCIYELLNRKELRKVDEEDLRMLDI